MAVLGKGTLERPRTQVMFRVLGLGLIAKNRNTGLFCPAYSHLTGPYLKPDSQGTCEGPPQNMVNLGPKPLKSNQY